MIRLAPRLVLVLFAVGLVHVGVMAEFTFLPLRLVALGGQPGDVALLAGLAAVAEIPAMLLAGAVARQIGLRGMFVGSAVLYGACLVSWIVLGTPALLIATRAISGLAFAGLVVSIVLTIGALLPPTLQATGQSLYQTIAFGLAAVISNALGGAVYATLGYGVFFGICAIFALVAALVGWVAVPGRSEAHPSPVLALD